MAEMVFASVALVTDLMQESGGELDGMQTPPTGAIPPIKVFSTAFFRSVMVPLYNPTTRHCSWIILKRTVFWSKVYALNVLNSCSLHSNHAGTHDVRSTEP